MASISPTSCISQRVNSNREIPIQVWFTREELDQPYDVTLVVRDGDFKAHRKVLSEASPFFEKLLNSDMKESKEGVVRLEIFTDSVMRNTLEFIYTGNVQILDEDDARDLVVIADYLLLKNLKTPATQTLLKELNTSSCTSIFHLADEYHCDELLCKTKIFILANFRALFSAKREDVLQMSKEELAIFISSDELHVSAEEDVLSIILAWINHDKNNRRSHFPELFRQVRLVYISRDFLCNEVVTNELVKNNEDCLELAKGAIELIDFNSVDGLDILDRKPRKCLEYTAIVAYTTEGKYLFYFPREDRWYKKEPIYLQSDDGIFFCRDKMYGTRRELLNIDYSWKLRILCYNPHSYRWKFLPPLDDNTLLKKLFVYNDEMYALFLIQKWRPVPDVLWSGVCRFKKESGIIISKYKVDSNSWENVLLKEGLPYRGHYCVVPSENFVYFIGGTKMYGRRLLRDVYRYDLSRKKWDKLADIQAGRQNQLWGAAANGKIYIAGWTKNKMKPGQDELLCEVYNETTNEWQFIRSFSVEREAFLGLIAVDGEVYVVGYDRSSVTELLRVQCYDPESDEWKLKTEISIAWHERAQRQFKICDTMKVFQGSLSSSQFTPCLTQDSSQTRQTHHRRDKRKCSIV